MANAVVANQTKYGITQAGADYVAGQLVEKEKAGLCFPANYSVKNAVQSAFLMLREAETKDGRPLLEVCTQDSVVQSLMQMTRLIDADELIEEIKGYRGDIFANEIVELINKMLTVGEWIPCSEQMPEEHDSVFKKFKCTDKWRSAMFEKMSDNEK